MDGNIYFLQYGSYISRDVMEQNVKELDNYLITEEDGKFYVYVGAFINLENAHKMQKIYENKNIYTYLKNDYIGDNKIIETISKLEKEVKESDMDLVKINKEIINILKKM